ncbi:hypothetical protein LguiB_001487 [Lonicera macranthoides]
MTVDIPSDVNMNNMQITEHVRTTNSLYFQVSCNITVGRISWYQRKVLLSAYRVQKSRVKRFRAPNKKPVSMASPIKKAKFDPTNAFSRDPPQIQADVENPPTYCKSPPPPQTAAKDIPNDWPENLAELYDPMAIEESEGDIDETSDDESHEKRQIKAMITSFMERNFQASF